MNSPSFFLASSCGGRFWGFRFQGSEFLGNQELEGGDVLGKIYRLENLEGKSLTGNTLKGPSHSEHVDPCRPEPSQLGPAP